ncbi:MAG: short-chain dehydrogenase, partial [Planctomycetaceae bacterium]
MDLGIAGQTAVVTGGSSGIGAAVAALLKAELACPVLWDLRPPDQSSPAAALPFLQVDVCDAAAVQQTWH